MDHIVKILSIGQITHDTKSFIVERPDNYSFSAGQATEVAINKGVLAAEKRPFTFTSLTNSPQLEFIIKIYKEHNGITKELGKLKPGDELIIGDAWGAIEYKGPGYFIAGGAGITPFIAILRKLKKDNQLSGNKLFFANKTSKDIILLRELLELLGKDVLFTLTNEDKEGFDHRYFDETFFKKEISDFNKNFYVCGPPSMINDIHNTLTRLGAAPDSVIFEK